MAEKREKLSISVVICAFNEQEWIAKTLASLTEQTRQADEIIIVKTPAPIIPKPLSNALSLSTPTSRSRLSMKPKKGCIMRGKRVGVRLIVILS